MFEQIIALDSIRQINSEEFELFLIFSDSDFAQNYGHSADEVDEYQLQPESEDAFLEFFGLSAEEIN